MFQVIGCIVNDHNPWLVLLAAVLCFFACTTVVGVVGRARASRDGNRIIWVLGAGAVAGCGIWATHFIAMLGFRPGFPISYGFGLTALSLFIAISLCCVGFSLAVMRRTSLLGGSLCGVALVAMHYVGVVAIRGSLSENWNLNLVAASIVIGIVGMTLGMREAARGRDLRSFCTAIAIFTATICATHFTGMAAIHLAYDPLSPAATNSLNPLFLAGAITGVAILILGVGLLLAIIDHHMVRRTASEAARLRSNIEELVATKHDLEQSLRERAIALTVAAAANKSKSAFLAAMSHELRTPLNAIIGFSEMMGIEAFGPVGNARYKEYVNDIHSSGKHLLSLINDILDLSRLDAGKAELHEESIELQALVGECLRLVETQAKAASVALETNIPDGIAPVLADERRLKQVLINLLANAVKFTPTGGHITVRVRHLPEGMAIAVTDTGIGIAPQDLHKAFENYGQIDSTVARKHVGAGLGLPLARQLMELHGGTLTLESRQNVGTTVTATLPAIRILACNISVAA